MGGGRPWRATQRLPRSLQGILFPVPASTWESELDSGSRFLRDGLTSPSAEPPKVQWLHSSSFSLENV